MEGTWIAEMMVLHTVPMRVRVHEEGPAPWWERERHRHARVTHHSSSDDKRDECTSAGGDEPARTATSVTPWLLNSAQHMLRARGSTGIEPISYSARLLSERELKRTQATSVMWLIAVARPWRG
jgi:hypothetical protein